MKAEDLREAAAAARDRVAAGLPPVRREWAAALAVGLVALVLLLASLPFRTTQRTALSVAATSREPRGLRTTSFARQVVAIRSPFRSKRWTRSDETATTFPSLETSQSVTGSAASWVQRGSAARAGTTRARQRRASRAFRFMSLGDG